MGYKIRGFYTYTHKGLDEMEGEMETNSGEQVEEEEEDVVA